jgi:hypothetical protein
MLWPSELFGREVASELIELSAFYDAAFNPALRQHAFASVCTYVGGPLASLLWHGAKGGMRCPH